MFNAIGLFESPGLTPVFFVGEVRWRGKLTNERWIHETNFSLSFWILLAT